MPDRKRVTDPTLLERLNSGAENSGAEQTPIRKKVTDPNILSQLNGDISSSAAPNYEQQVYDSVKKRGYSDQAARLIVAQAKHESDNFKSNVFKKSNNPFGMTYAGQSGANASTASQPASEGGTSYAGYNNVEGATDNLLAWIERRKSEGKFDPATDFGSPEAYAKALKKSSYYTAPISEYSGGLSRYYQPPAPTTPTAPGPIQSHEDWQNPQATIDVGNAPQGISQGLRPYAGSSEITTTQGQQPINTAPAPVNPAKTKTEQYSDALTQDVMSVAQSGQAPAYAENVQQTPVNSPGSVVYQLTNPSGDPDFTGKYFQFRSQQLKQQQAAEEERLSQQLARGEKPAITPADIAEKYNTKERQLQDAVNHILTLQLANKELASDKVKGENVGAQIEALETEKQEALAKAAPEERAVIESKYALKQRELSQNQKFDAVQLGLQQAVLMGDRDAQRDLEKYRAGLKIDPARKVAYESNGYQILQEGAQHATEKGDAQAATELAANSDNIQKRLEKSNPEYFKKMWANAVGDYAYNNEHNPIYGTLWHRPKLTPEEIKKYGKAAGLEDYQIAQLTPEDVPTASSLLGQATQSAFNTFLLKDENSPGGKFFTGETPAAQHSLDNYKGVLGEMAGGVGMMAGFVAQSGLLGAGLKGARVFGDLAQSAKKYETAANMIPLAITNYNSAYHTAKEVVGDAPEDAAKRNLYAFTVGSITTAIMGLDPVTKLGKDAIEKSAEKNLANILKGADLSTLGKEEYQTAVQKTISNIHKYAEIGAETGKHALSQGAIMGATKMSENLANMVFDPDHRHGVMDNVGEAAISGAVAMFVPSLMAGINSSRANTPMNRDIMIDVALHPDKYTKFVSEQLANEKITPEAAQQMHDGILGMREAIQQVPATNIDGQLLTVDQQKDYAFNLFQESRLQQKAQELQAKEGAMVDKAQVAPITKRITELQNERNDILGNAGQEVALPERAPEEEKKSAEKVAQPEEKNVSLTPTSENETLTTKTNENESISRNERGQDGSEVSQGEEKRPDSEVQSSASGQVSREQENRQLKEPETANNKKAAKEQPLSVSERKKKLAALIEEEPQPEKVATSVISPEEGIEYTASREQLSSIRTQKKSNYDHDLQMSIEKEGVKEPVTVVYYPEEDVYALSDGHHRIDAAEESVIDNLPVKVKIASPTQEPPKNAKHIDLSPKEKSNQGTEPSTERRNEVPSEAPASVTKKENENASTQSQGLQQESLQQGSEPEHARTEQAGGKEAPAETKNSNSDKRSAGPKEEVKPASQKNAHKKGWSLRRHLERKEKVLREEPVSMEEYVLQTMLGMNDKEPEHKWAFSSVEKDIPKGYTEKQVVKQFASDHPRATPIDVWAQDVVNSIGEKYGNLPFHVPDVQEITNIIRDNISRFRTKQELLNHLEAIHEDRRQKEIDAESKRYARVEVGKDEKGEPIYDHIDTEEQQTEHDLAMQYAGLKGEEFEGYNDEGHPIFKELSEKYDQIDEAKVKAEDEQKIKDFYASHYDEQTGEVNYDAAHTDYNALQELKKGLSDAGRELMDSIVPFNDFAQHNENIQRLIKEVSAYEKQRRENTATADPEEGTKPEGVTEGGGAPREPESDAKSGEFEKAIDQVKLYRGTGGKMQKIQMDKYGDNVLYLTNKKNYANSFTLEERGNGYAKSEGAQLTEHILPAGAKVKELSNYEYQKLVADNAEKKISELNTEDFNKFNDKLRPTYDVIKINRIEPVMPTEGKAGIVERGVELSEYLILNKKVLEEKQNEAPVDERSVATDAEPETEASATKERLKAIDEELLKQRASQKREAELRAKADKADDIEGFNKHNENWYKKQEKINRLLDENPHTILYVIEVGSEATYIISTWFFSLFLSFSKQVFYA